MPMTNQEVNLSYAQEAINYVHSKLLYGSNTKKASQSANWKPELSLIIRNEVYRKAFNYALEHDGKTPFHIFCQLHSDALIKYGFGKCGEQAQTAFLYLAQKGVFPLNFCITSIGEHNFIVIGKGKEAVICDPWAEKAYPISHFKEMQKPENDIRYPDICYEHDPKPYLAGNICSEFYAESMQDFKSSEIRVNNSFEIVEANKVIDNKKISNVATTQIHTLSQDCSSVSESKEEEEEINLSSQKEEQNLILVLPLIKHSILNTKKIENARGANYQLTTPKT